MTIRAEAAFAPSEPVPKRKLETQARRVPLARILQEQKDEARLLAGHAHDRGGGIQRTGAR